MSLKYGDSVVLIQKSRDGTLRRVNAIVLRSASQPANATRPTGLRNANGALLAEGEYLDLAYPRELPQGQTVKSSDMNTTFQPTHATPPWQEGASIGWEEAPTEDSMASLVAALDLSRAHVAELSAQLDQNPVAPVIQLPSAEDLDAVAADQQAADATASPDSGA